MFKKTFVLFIFLFVFQTFSVSAATIVERWGLPDGNLIRDDDGWRLYYSLTDVDSFINSEGQTRSLAGASYMYFNCNGTREATFLKNGQTVGYIKVNINDITNEPQACKSNENEDNDSGNNECSTAVCECIATLGSINQGIKDSINQNGNTLDSIKNAINGTNDKLDTTNGKLDDVKSAINQANNSIKDFHDEFKTDKTYKPKELPDVSDLLDKNKPDFGNNKFEDKNTYFKDNGDSNDVIDDLPSAMDPPDNWDGTFAEDELSKENELKPDKFDKDSELSKDEFDKENELKPDKFDKDNELSKDEFEKENELKPDKFDKDNELSKDDFQKDNELSQDNFDKDSEFSKDDFHLDREMLPDREFSKDNVPSKSPVLKVEEFQQNNNFNQTNQFDRTHIYEQTNKFPK